MKKALVTFAIAIGLVAAMVAPAAAPTHQATTKASSHSRGAVKIKSKSPHNVAGHPAPKPKQKGGKTRGAPSTELIIENSTGYYIDVYYDGVAIGTVAPYGSSSAYEPSGSHQLYASAPGTSLTWGPVSASLNDDGDFTWTLTP